MLLPTQILICGRRNKKFRVLRWFTIAKASSYFHVNLDSNSLSPPRSSKTNYKTKVTLQMKGAKIRLGVEVRSPPQKKYEWKENCFFMTAGKVLCQKKEFVPHFCDNDAFGTHIFFSLCSTAV